LLPESVISYLRTSLLRPGAIGKKYQTSRAKIVSIITGVIIIIFIFDYKLIVMQEKQWALICHLSGLSGYLIPFGNIIIPIVIWSMKKEEMPMVDEHGKEVINFQLSITIWIIISGLLIILLVGIPMLIVLVILQVVLVIIGALKADNGQLYKYPMTIRFIK
jgi:uncharacterized Tic20 family protein